MNEIEHIDVLYCTVQCTYSKRRINPARYTDTLQGKLFRIKEMVIR